MIRGVLEAEVHFWGATIEERPQTQLDETEDAWVVRILQLAEQVGCSPDNRGHLAHLRKWVAERNS